MMTQHFSIWSSLINNLSKYHGMPIVYFWAFMSFYSVIYFFNTFFVIKSINWSYRYLTDSFHKRFLFSCVKCLAITLLVKHGFRISSFKLTLFRINLSCMLLILMLTTFVVTGGILSVSNTLVITCFDDSFALFSLLLDYDTIIHLINIKDFKKGIEDTGPTIIVHITVLTLATSVGALTNDPFLQPICQLVSIQLIVFLFVLLTLMPAMRQLIESHDNLLISNVTIERDYPAPWEVNGAQIRVKMQMVVVLSLIHICDKFYVPLFEQQKIVLEFKNQILHWTYLDYWILVIYVIIWFVYSRLRRPSVVTKEISCEILDFAEKRPEIAKVETVSVSTETTDSSLVPYPPIRSALPPPLRTQATWRRAGAAVLATSLNRRTSQHSFNSQLKLKTRMHAHILATLPSEPEEFHSEESSPNTSRHVSRRVSRRISEAITLNPADTPRIRRISNLLPSVDVEDCQAKIAQDLGYSLEDAEILYLVEHEYVKPRQLEQILQDYERAVNIRRDDLARRIPNPHALDRIPYIGYDYKAVFGQCCEEVIGYVPFPLGKVGPLLLDGKMHFIPIATTEGCLVASTNRGCRVVQQAGGIQSIVYRNHMTRAPVVYFSTVMEMAKCKTWLESAEGFHDIKTVFDSTSSHADLFSVLAVPCGTYLHIRFAAHTGEAMGMNMVSKGTEKALQLLKKQFPKVEIMSISGNMCADKKPSAINWILGRGKSVVAECRINKEVLQSVLQTDASSMARLCLVKNWTGSAMAGAMGGFNAHAANLIAAVFAATGQDIAQVVDACACLTLMEAEPDGSLHVCCTLPCLEVGTVGGGTRLGPQRACLDLMDLSVESPTEHLARLVAGTVLCAELSLVAALTTSQLVEAHMRLNRANSNIGGKGGTRRGSAPRDRKQSIM